MTGFDRRFILFLWIKTVKVIVVWMLPITFVVDNPSRKDWDTTTLAVIDRVFHDNSFQRTGRGVQPGYCRFDTTHMYLLGDRR